MSALAYLRRHWKVVLLFAAFTGIFALVFSVLVGLVSGYQPANKAVKISALEAIRNE